MSKKEFAWKDSQEVGEVIVTEGKKKIAVELNSLDFESTEGTEERWYISLATKQFFTKKPEKESKWHITKNATFTLDTWEEIKGMVDNYIGE